MYTTDSTWPVVLIPYNLPPWVCLKPSSFILSLIIPGKSSPGINIDVYLQPLIHELKLLWDGVVDFDAYSNECSLCKQFSDAPSRFSCICYVVQLEYQGLQSMPFMC